MSEAKHLSSNDQVKYLNTIVEQGNRSIKRVTKPMAELARHFNLPKGSWLLAGIGLMRLIGKGQLMREVGNERSFADQFYALAGQLRPLRGTGIRSPPKHVHRPTTRKN